MAERKSAPPPRPRRRSKWSNADKAKDFKKAAGRLMKLYRKHLPLAVLALTMLLGATAFNAAAPAVLGRAITNHLERSLDLSLFFRQMVILVVIYSGAFLTHTAGSVIIDIVSNRIIFRLRRDAFAHVQRLSIGYFDKKGIGDLISRLTNDIETVHDFIANGLFSSINGLFTFVGILIAMVLLNLPMTGVLLIVVPVIALLVVKIGRIVQKDAKENQKQVGALTAAIEESVTGVKVIQSFHREREERQEFTATAAKARDAAIKLQRSSYLMMPTMQLLSGLALVIVIGFGGSMVIVWPEVFSIGLVTAFIVYARRIVEPFRQIANVYTLFNSALAGAERVFEVIDSDEEIEKTDNPRSARDIEGVVEFRGVTFGYDAEKPVLEDISLKAEPGEVTAIVGPTGAGKTTIINLLARFYDAQKGEILIDGADIREYELYGLRSKMGIVLQEPFFFAETVRENLLFGRPDASEQEMVEAAQTAFADHFIARLPHGYDTVLTERGMNLSQGERQLLGIARTILSNPRILILDEATSSVDSLTERKIQKAVNKLMKGRTNFVIAHRLSTIKRADRLLVIHNHRIVERGTHRELMEKGGFYSRLYELQFEVADIGDIKEEEFSGDVYSG